MKIRYPSLVLVTSLILCGCSEKKTVPRIAIAGLAIESSTFSPAQTHEEAFHARTGDTILSSYSFLSPDSILYKKAQWFPILIGRSLPGGIVTREAYESLMAKMLDGLKQSLPYDVLYYSLCALASSI